MKQNEPHRFTSLHYLLIILLFLIFIDGLALWFAARTDYHYTLGRTKAILEKSSLSLEERMKRTVIGADAIVQTLAERIQLGRMGEAKTSAQERERLVKIASGLPDRGFLVFMDNNANLILHSEKYPSPRFNYSDREYFKAHSEKRVNFYIGPIVKGKISNKYNFTISRRVTGKNGEFLGVIVAAIETENYADFLDYLDIGKGSTVAVFRTDGTMILRQPMQIDFLGRTFQNQAWFTMILNGELSGTYEAAGVDGRRRFVSYRKITGLPLVVATTVPVDSILEGWRSRVKIYAAVSIAIFFSLIALAWLVRRTTLREEQQKAEELSNINRMLQTEIGERSQMEEELRKSRDELEYRVQERTVQLREAYESLQLESRERQKAEDQLRQSQKMEAIGTLAGGIAHDFNNILAAILGFTEMAIDDVADRSPAKTNLKNVLKSAMRARDLVKRILTFSRKTSYDRTPISLSPLVKETLQLLRATIPATIEIKLSITATSDTVLAAPTEVQQILMNLVANASLAMEETGGVIEISLADVDFMPDSAIFGTEMVSGEYVQLMVRDTGTGMSPDVMRRVFEPFFTTRELGMGTGMGLAVVYGIVTDLEGTITVESDPGVGSIFRIFLPKAKAEVKEDQSSGDLQIPTGTESILFIDDEDMLVEWAKATLEKLGYLATALTDPVRALKIFASDPLRFDLVITDQAMPAMSGMHLAGELLAIRPDIPIILCTGHSAAVSPEKAKKAGIKEFLMKPVDSAEIAKVVRKVLDEKNSA